MEYRIGSFNMKNFGANSSKDFEVIAQIIEKENLDVVALQEILSEGKGVRRMLEESTQYDLRNWDFCCDNPRESSDSEKNIEMVTNDSRGECYAYLWNKRSFKLAEYTSVFNTKTFEPRIINSLSNDVKVDCSFFARTPYYIRLEPLFGGFFELRLVNIHIYYGDNSISSIIKRKIEFDTLVHDIYPAISYKRYGTFRHPYTIAMGDYNLNIFRPYTNTQSTNAYLSEVCEIEDGQKRVQVLTIQEQLTTLKNPTTDNDCDSEFGDGNYLANNYDHFSYSKELSPFRDVTYEVVDAVNKYCNGDYLYYRSKVSDHLPIVMTVSI